MFTAWDCGCGWGVGIVFLVGAILGLFVAVIALDKRKQQQGIGMIWREEWLTIMGERVQEWGMMAVDWRFTLLPRFHTLAVAVDV